MRTLAVVSLALALAGAFLAVAVGPAVYRAWPALVAFHKGV